MDCEETIVKIVEWLKSKVRTARMRGLTLGLSGGLDSSVAGILCKKTGYPTLGLILPCHSQRDTVSNAVTLADKFGIEYKIIDLTETYDRLTMLFKEAIGSGDPNAEANIKPRLRMLTLYYLANSLSYLVVGTGNYTELRLGYFTKYGDGGADLLPLGDLVKGEVRQLASRLGVPEEIVKRPPSADLRPGQTDEAELGFKYEVLDKVARGNYSGLPVEVVEAVKKRVSLNRHKRSPPPICRVH